MLGLRALAAVGLTATHAQCDSKIELNQTMSTARAVLQSEQDSNERSAGHVEVNDGKAKTDHALDGGGNEDC